MIKLFATLFKKKAITPTNSKFIEGWKAYEEGKNFFYQDKKEEDALQLFDKAIECGITKAYAERAFCLQALGYWADSIPDFDLAILYEPNDPNLYFSRGLAKKVNHDFNSAISDMEMAVNLAKESSKLNNEYNDEMSKSGWQNAAQYFQLKLEECKNMFDSAKRNPELYEKLKEVKLRAVKY